MICGCWGPCDETKTTTIKQVARRPSSCIGGRGRGRRRGEEWWEEGVRRGERRGVTRGERRGVRRGLVCKCWFNNGFSKVWLESVGFTKVLARFGNYSVCPLLMFILLDPRFSKIRKTFETCCSPH